MDHVNYFKDLFESILDYRTKVLLLSFIKTDVDKLQEYGCLKYDINHLCKEYKIFLLERNEENLIYFKKRRKNIFGKDFKKVNGSMFLKFV